MNKYSKSNETRRALQARIAMLSQENSTQIVLMHEIIGQKVGLSASDMKCFSFISDGPLTAGEIARRMGLTTGTVTSLIDRLEQRGAVQRTPDASDRRKVVVQANPDFVEKVTPLYEHLVEAGEALLARYTAEEQTFIADFLEQMIAGRKETIEKIRATKV